MIIDAQLIDLKYTAFAFELSFACVVDQHKNSISLYFVAQICTDY